MFLLENLKEFLEEDKISEFEKRTNERFASLIFQIGKTFIGAFFKFSYFVFLQKLQIFSKKLLKIVDSFKPECSPARKNDLKLLCGLSQIAGFVIVYQNNKPLCNFGNSECVSREEIVKMREIFFEFVCCISSPMMTVTAS